MLASRIFIWNFLCIMINWLDFWYYYQIIFGLQTSTWNFHTRQLRMWESFRCNHFFTQVHLVVGTFYSTKAYRVFLQDQARLFCFSFPNGSHLNNFVGQDCSWEYADCVFLLPCLWFAHTVLFQHIENLVGFSGRYETCTPVSHPIRWALIYHI